MFMQNKYIHTPGTTTKAKRCTIMPPRRTNDVFRRIHDENTSSTTDVPERYTMPPLPQGAINEVFYRIIDDDEPAGAAEPNQAFIFIYPDRRVMVFHSRRVYYRRMIPVGGFERDDFMDMAARLELRPTELAQSLNRRQYRGIAGEFVQTLAEFYSLWIDPATQERMQQLMQRLQQRQPRAPRLNAVEDEAALPPDEVCAICLETCSNTPGKGWSTAEGCSAHRFHTDCILKWTAGTCPMCRRELLTQ
jgi:hypothetical protein